MKKFLALLPLAALIIAPLSASAHEQDTFRINGKEYFFVIGSLNEPLVVDDKSGVDLTVSRGPAVMRMMDDGDMELSGAPVAGLEETLQVELIAGTQKKTLDLSPVYGKEGGYKAPFFPTVATTLSYRIFGTIDDTPVDLLFSCNPAGHTEGAEDTTEVKLSDKVTHVSKEGAFTCPVEKAGMGFPEASADIRSLDEKSGGANGMATVALALSVVALVGVGYASRKKA